MSRSLTIGTAGHVDHGKTALVLALTGEDTDRLAEEKRRGISIELGYAELNLGDWHLSLIDVPGHERLVRTMVSGATGIDFFLMTIAADDGVMPQTLEHLTVLHALGVRDGVVALTKCDLADDGVRGKARQQARELLPGVPLIEVSARTGQGMEELRCALRETAGAIAEGVVPSTDSGDPVLHVDRVFTVPGRGTVVTGTLWSGGLAPGDRVVLLPGGERVRIREVQVHGRTANSAGPRQRVALNLAGVGREEVERGSVVVGFETTLSPTYRLDIEVTVGAEELLVNQRVQVHHGTRETPARVAPLGLDLIQLRLEGQLIAKAGDRVIIRRIAPPSTIGGGRVLDAQPRRHGPGPATKRLRTIQKGRVDGSGEGTPAEGEVEQAAAVVSAPLDTPKPKPDDPLLAAELLAILREDGTTPRGVQALANAVAADRGHTVEVLESLVTLGEITRIGVDVYYRRGDLQVLQDQIVPLIRTRGSITVAELRDFLGVSRKYAQALLDDLDSRKITIRHGEGRRLRRTHALDKVVERPVP